MDERDVFDAHLREAGTMVARLGDKAAASGQQCAELAATLDDIMTGLRDLGEAIAAWIGNAEKLRERL